MRPTVLGMRVEEAVDGAEVGVGVGAGVGVVGAGVALGAGSGVGLDPGACGCVDGAGKTPGAETDPPPPPQAASNETSTHAINWRESRTGTFNRRTNSAYSARSPMILGPLSLPTTERMHKAPSLQRVKIRMPGPTPRRPPRRKVIMQACAITVRYRIAIVSYRGVIPLILR